MILSNSKLATQLFENVGHKQLNCKLSDPSYILMLKILDTDVVLMKGCEKIVSIYIEHRAFPITVRKTSALSINK